MNEIKYKTLISALDQRRWTVFASMRGVNIFLENKKFNKGFFIRIYYNSCTNFVREISVDGNKGAFRIELKNFSNYNSLAHHLDTYFNNNIKEKFEIFYDKNI